MNRERVKKYQIGAGVEIEQEPLTAPRHGFRGSTDAATEENLYNMNALNR
jgi:hypothetical protein